MKRAVLAVLLAIIVAHAPWRLMHLAAQTVVMHKGKLHLKAGTDRYWDAMGMESRIMGLRYAVRYEHDPRIQECVVCKPKRVYGYTDYDEHLVVVDEALSWNERFDVLSHEAGHILQPLWLEDDQQDVFAEAVAYLVVGDSVIEHARYLSMMKVDTLLVLTTEWRAIYHAAAVLEDR